LAHIPGVLGLLLTKDHHYHLYILEPAWRRSPVIRVWNERSRHVRTPLVLCVSPTVKQSSR
jgi:hypothetical protein